MGKRIQQLLLAIPFLFFGVGSYGSTYFSYVEEVESTSATNNTYHYQFDYWKASSPTEGNPCVAVLGAVGAKKCYFTINHLHEGKDTGGVASRIDWDCRINFATYKTMEAIIGDARDLCGLTFPYRGSSRHSGRITTDECVGLFLGDSQRESKGKILPGGICGIAPPPAGKCYFTSPTGSANSLELNHGALNADELNGDVETGLFYIQCNKDMSVKVSSNLQQDNVYLRPNGELQSYVTLNNQSASKGLVQSVKANQVWPVQVASTLRTNGAVAPGKFSGRITLVLTIP
ncbi:TPA: hypothetical protein ACPFI9_002730 [Providencia rettgeri]